MPTNSELQVEQKRRLYLLLKLRQDNQGVKIKGLNQRIQEVKAEMQQEDVAWVEKTVEENTDD